MYIPENVQTYMKNKDIQLFLTNNCNDSILSYLDSIVINIGEQEDKTRLWNSWKIELCIDKSLKRLYDVINNIDKYVKSTNTQKSKQYQIRGYYEYKIVSKYCELNKIEHELIMSETQTTNKVVNIIQNCYCGDGEPVVHKGINRKVPCMYIKIIKCK